MRTLLATMAAVALTAAAHADLAPYSQDFEGLDQTNPDALANDGWLVFGNVFDPGGGYLYGYGPFGAPNGGPGFSAIATGEAGPNQGLQYLNAYSDYNNGDHANGNLIEANVFQEQIVGAPDLGQSFDFNFDYKASFEFGPAGSTSTMAFIKVLDPDAGFSLVEFITLETTDAPNDVWTEDNTLSVAIDAAWEGHILQFGFLSTATLFEDSGVFYDNISFNPVPAPASAMVLALGLLGRRRRR